MSVRMALAKLSACAAGCAMIGGGAVHVAETQSAKTEYRKVKVAKTAAPAKTYQPVKRVVRREQPRTVKRVRKIIKRTCCEQPQMARRELRVASVLHQRGHQRVFPVCTPEFRLVARPWGGNGAEWQQRRDADGI